MEGVMETEAVEGLARALATEFPVPESYEAWKSMVDRTYQSDAAMLLGRLRADPAAARAVRDAIDPDGLRDLLEFFAATAECECPNHLEAVERARRLLEGTPDAD